MKNKKAMKGMSCLLGVLLISAISLMGIAPSVIAAETVSFQDGLDSYAGTRDTYIYSSNPDTNYGTASTMYQDIDPGERRSLLLFDLSSIPTGSTILSAELQFYVSSEGKGFDMHRMLDPWEETVVTYSTVGSAESAIDTNWPGDNGYTGLITVSVPASTIQDWVDGTLTNNGWLMIATDTEGDGQQLATREYSTQEDKPKLTVEYLPPPIPTITVTGVPLSAFSSEPGTPSAEQNYTVAGSNLTDDIEIIAPTDFEISFISGSGFGSSLMLYQSGGSVAETTIYVRFNRAAWGISAGDITHDSDGAATQNVAVSGEAAIASVFQDGLDGYSGTRDTYIWDDEPDTSHGVETTIVQDINTSDERRSLLYFDVSSIPPGTILSSELQFYVSAEGQGFNMHRMLTSWDEAATYNSIGGEHFKADDIDAESSVNANWPGDDGYTGFITVSVPASTIQDWVGGTLTNNGWLMIATHESDGQQLASREYGTQENRPKLTVAYLPGDLDHDCDVDGSDLRLLIADPESMDLGEFAGVFGTAAECL